MSSAHLVAGAFCFLVFTWNAWLSYSATTLTDAAVGGFGAGGALVGAVGIWTLGASRSGGRR